MLLPLLKYLKGVNKNDACLALFLLNGVKTAAMTMLSFDMNSRSLEELDAVVKKEGFESRSEAMRFAIRKFIEESRVEGQLEGMINGTVTVVQERDIHHMPELLHEFEDVIYSSMHVHLSPSECFQLFIVSGDARRISGFVKRLEKMKKVTYAKLFARNPHTKD